MIFLKFKPFQSSKIWEFQDPDVPHRLHVGTSKEKLLSSIISYRAQNRLPLIEELSSVVENYLCKHPLNAGACEPFSLKRGFMGYVKGAVALLSNLRYNKFASQEEADRRSDICITCPHNVFLDRDAFIKWSDKIAEASVGDRKSKNHDKLGNCEICSCSLRGKVFYDGKPDLEKKVMDRLPSFCWQLDK